MDEDVSLTYAVAEIRAAAVSAALDERDSATHDHCDRVSGLALALGRACGLSARELRQLTLAAAFHDVGKIGIPDVVLKKPGPLTNDEWRLMRSHSARSERIVLAAALDDSAEIARAVRQHHERIDGTGYPDGVGGEDISILSRIIAVADAYDAMARMRLYGQPKAHDGIMEELQRHRGKQHDAYVLQKFSALIAASPYRID